MGARVGGGLFLEQGCSGCAYSEQWYSLAPNSQNTFPSELLTLVVLGSRLPGSLSIRAAMPTLAVCEIVGTRLSCTVWGFSAAELATVTSPDLKQKAFPEAISACAETSLGLGATVVPWCPPSHSVLNLRAAMLLSVHLPSSLDSPLTL